MPLPWFRRKTRTQEQPATEEAPAVVEGPRAEGPKAEDRPAAPPQGEAPRKRRRGSRGGRNRRKPAATTADSTPPRQQPARAPKTQKEDSKPDRQRRPNTRRRQAPRRAPLPAAKRELLVSVDVTEKRVAVLEDDRVAEVYLERPERRSIAGNIYKGVVDNVLPGMEAAFVEIGLEKNGFLFVDEIVGPEL